ncbi:MAG: DEAD/DEAH box helicase [Candidatus Nanopelagicales bacterium]|nr:DEAD/DEAH box helicase [Candidatus Nanopelagicales bacterium]MCF8538190.1 DEAD/DEAH box helicase [Candidatus Nanopelagicales bacterium]MCF8543240.1 DEAD/DEAH box helicase [Candidatus Nanopelagicales bacterium]MCF8558298.1 DEAD/DEAH box helicase [Candidatus Nanopelagicales bacterium]
MSAPLSFDALGVAPALAAALKSDGITEPFPIQTATLPDAIAGRDILGRGRTGSGKTLAFGLALLTRLAGWKAEPGKPLGLVLVPTRELAMQVSDTLSPLAMRVQLRTRLIAGGMPYAQQLRALERGVPILVATPGRLIDLMERGAVDLSATEVVVLDEADQMADMGFLPVVKQILDATKPKGQRLLFSATLDNGVDTLVKRYLRDPAEHSTGPITDAVTTMDHHVLVVHPADKNAVTAQIAARDGRTIFFVRTQRGVDKLAEQLAEQGVPVGALHGGKSQAVRTRTLNDFRNGITPTLVATDVAARGIHVDGVSLVVHVDAPTDPKDYTHRAGRTARAGDSGTVVTLAYPKQQRAVASLTKRAGVEAAVSRVRPGDDDLRRVTGSQEPSGIPWKPKPVRDARPKKPYARRPHSKAGAGATNRSHSRSHQNRGKFRQS